MTLLVVLLFLESKENPVEWILIDLTLVSFMAVLLCCILVYMVVSFLGFVNGLRKTSSLTNKKVLNKINPIKVKVEIEEKSKIKLTKGGPKIG